MAEKLQDGTNIVAVFDEMGGEGVAEGVAGVGFGEAGLGNGGFDGPLQRFFAEMVAADEAGAGIGGEGAGGKDPLPAEFSACVRVLDGQDVGEKDIGPAVGEVIVMEQGDAGDLASEGFFEGLREPCDFGACEDDRKTLRVFGGLDAVEGGEWELENIAVKKQEGIAGDILGAGGDGTVDGEVYEVVAHLCGSERAGVSASMKVKKKVKKTAYGVRVGVFGMDTQVPAPCGFAHLVKQGLRWGCAGKETGGMGVNSWVVFGRKC